MISEILLESFMHFGVFYRFNIYHSLYIYIYIDIIVNHV